MAREPAKLNESHLQLMDVLFLEPSISIAEAAGRIGMSPGTAYHIASTDTFKFRLEERRRQHEARLEGELLSRLTGKAAKLAEVAIDSLTEKIEENRRRFGLAPKEAADENLLRGPPPEVSVQDLKAAASLGLSVLAPAPALSPSLRPAHVTVDRELLREARMRITERTMTIEKVA